MRLKPPSTLCILGNALGLLSVLAFICTHTLAGELEPSTALILEEKLDLAMQGEPSELIATILLLEAQAGTTEAQTVLESKISKQKKTSSRYLTLSGMPALAIPIITLSPSSSMLSTALVAMAASLGIYSFSFGRIHNSIQKTAQLMIQRNTAREAQKLLTEFDKKFMELTNQTLPEEGRFDALESFFFDRQLAAAEEKKALPPDACNAILDPP